SVARRTRRLVPGWMERPWAAFAASMLGVSLLYCFLDPTFGFNTHSASLYAGILSGLVVVTVAFDLVALWFMWRRHRERGAFRGYAIALPIAGACVLVSRLAGFQPGYLLGAIAGFTFAVTLSERDQG